MFLIRCRILIKLLSCLMKICKYVVSVTAMLVLLIVFALNRKYIFKDSRYRFAM